MNQTLQDTYAHHISQIKQVAVFLDMDCEIITHSNNTSLRYFHAILKHKTDEDIALDIYSGSGVLDGDKTRFFVDGAFPHHWDKNYHKYVRIPKDKATMKVDKKPQIIAKEIRRKVLDPFTEGMKEIVVEYKRNTLLKQMRNQAIHEIADFMGEKVVFDVNQYPTIYYDKEQGNHCVSAAITAMANYNEQECAFNLDIRNISKEKMKKIIEILKS